MTAALAEPLINGMATDRILPVHESSRRLRKLAPEGPRVHGVAVMSDTGRRRWHDRLGRSDRHDAAGAAGGSGDHRRSPAARRDRAGHVGGAPLPPLPGAGLRRAGANERRRARAVLDALTCFGLPVRADPAYRMRGPSL